MNRDEQCGGRMSRFQGLAESLRVASGGRKLWGTIDESKSGSHTCVLINKAYDLGITHFTGKPTECH